MGVPIISKTEDGLQVIVSSGFPQCAGTDAIRKPIQVLPRCGLEWPSRPVVAVPGSGSVQVLAALAGQEPVGVGMGDLDEM
jgi:hypothetical protein